MPRLRVLDLTDELAGELAAEGTRIGLEESQRGLALLSEEGCVAAVSSVGQVTTVDRYHGSGGESGLWVEQGQYHVGDVCRTAPTT